MIESIRSYFRLSKLAKVLDECQQREFSNQVEAMRACNRLVRTSGKDYSIVKHQQEQRYWVVRTPSANILVNEGHLLVKPYK